MPETLKTIAAEIAVCKNCELSRTRTYSVPGEGNPDTEIMLIGEGPGKNEDLEGRPFIGQAGKLLTELLANAGLTREDVFICNVVKCRPPLNRDPEPAELAACNAYLDRQIAVIKPSIIITLGRFSMANFFEDVKISQVHGMMKRVGDTFVIPMFHPAAALHQPALKPAIREDFSKLPKLLAMARKELGLPAKQNIAKPEPLRQPVPEQPKHNNLSSDKPDAPEGKQLKLL